MSCDLKIFVAAAVVVFGFATYTVQQTSDPAFMQKFNTSNADCATQYNFTIDYVYNQIWTLQAFPDDKNLKCFFSCVNVKIGVMDASGNINDAALKQVAGDFYNVTIDDDIAKNCDIAKEGDVCQTAFDMMTCVLNAQNGKV